MAPSTIWAEVGGVGPQKGSWRSLSLLPGCICPHLLDSCRLAFVWRWGPLSSQGKGWCQLWDGALTSAAAMGMEAIEAEGHGHCPIPQPSRTNTGPCFGATASDHSVVQRPRATAPPIQFPRSDGTCPPTSEMWRWLSTSHRLTAGSSRCFVLLAVISIREP